MEARCRCKYKEVEKEKNQNQSPRKTVFQITKPVLLAVTVSKGKNSVSHKFHDHSDHVLIWTKSQQLA